MNEQNKKLDLEDRLIDFSVQVLNVSERLPNTKAANHVAGQMVRSCTSPALNYGEAQEAESRNDFIHKMSVCRKELRETRIALRILLKKSYQNTNGDAEKALNECNQLLATFSKSITTAKQNAAKK